MGLFRKKTATEKVQDVLDDPEASREYMDKLREIFIKRTPWNNVTDYKVHLDDKGWGRVEHEKIGTKRQIENFIEDDLKANLQSGELYTGIVGDADWARRSKFYNQRRIVGNIERLLERCGPGSMRILMDPSVEKLGSPFQNAEKLERLGVDVRVRNSDANVRAVVVGPREEQAEPEYLAGIVWKSYAKDPGFKRVVGHAQKPKDMVYDGFTMKWEGDIEEPEAIYLNALNDYANRLWNDSVKTIDDLIEERERTEYQINSGKVLA